MSRRERVQSKITLTSPTGIVFSAFWVGDSRLGEKKLGVTSFPGLPGFNIQDLDVNGFRWPIPVIFEGEDNDTDAGKFMIALKEKGPWSIIHPEKGELTLFPVSFKENIAYVADSNTTRIDTVWLQKDFVDLGELAPQLQVEVDNLITESNAVITENIDNNLNIADEAQKQNFINKVNTFVNLIDDSLKSLTKSVANINARIEAIKSGIQTVLAEAVLDIVALTGQINTLIQLPLETTEDFFVRLNLYESLITNSLALIPINIDKYGITQSKNESILTETITVSSFIAVSKILSDSDIKSRTQAIEGVDRYFAALDEVINGLDDKQELFLSTTIEAQYISLLESFSSIFQLSSKSVESIMQNFFNVAIEKTIPITKPTAPFVLVWEEYGELGDNDENIDEFIAINSLKRNDILLLKSGTSVTVYV
jgi:prophage DNA circulation protein